MRDTKEHTARPVSKGFGKTSFCRRGNLMLMRLFFPRRPKAQVVSIYLSSTSFHLPSNSSSLILQYEKETPRGKGTYTKPTTKNQSSWV